MSALSSRPSHQATIHAFLSAQLQSKDAELFVETWNRMQALAPPAARTQFERQLFLLYITKLRNAVRIVNIDADNRSESDVAQPSKMPLQDYLRASELDANSVGEALHRWIRCGETQSALIAELGQKCTLVLDELWTEDFLLGKDMTKGWDQFKAVEPLSAEDPRRQLTSDYIVRKYPNAAAMRSEVLYEETAEFVEAFYRHLVHGEEHVGRDPPFSEELAEAFAAMLRGEEPPRGEERPRHLFSKK